MTPSGPPIESLADHAHDTRIVVVGGGIAGLVAALECAKVGLRVTLLESASHLGGTVRAAELDGVTVDVGADGYATAGGHVRGLIEELGLTHAVRRETGKGTSIAGPWFGTAPLPAGSVLGIPANVWDPDVRRIIGWRGVWRAYLDRLRPPLTIGQQRNLDTLVRGRMGDLVADRLVAPLTLGGHGLRPSEVDAEIAAPGIGTALTRTGSLSGAAADLAADPAPGYETLEGGMSRLVAALGARLGDLGAEVRTGAGAEALVRSGTAWEVLAGDDRLAADVVIVATGERAARRLLAPHVRGLAAEPERTRALAVVTLVTASPLSPGTALYPVPGTSSVSAVLRPTARWESLAENVGTGRSLVRVLTYRDAASSATDAEDIAAAVAEASRLLDVALAPVDARIDRFEPALPQSALGRVADAERVRTAVSAAVPSLAVVGDWIAGTGLARVIPDAAAEAERVRRAALFGD